MRDRAPAFGDPIGPWTALHGLGAGVVVLLFLGLATGIWPGWPQLFASWV